MGLIGTLSAVTMLGALLAVLACLVAGRARLVEGWVATPAMDRGVLAALVAGQLWVIGRWVPWAPWHTNNHGTERIRAIVEGAELGAVVMPYHGSLWEVPARLGWLSGSVDGIFASSAVVTVLTTIAAYLFCRVLLERRLDALMVFAVLGFLPFRLRVAPTAALYVPAELALVVSLGFAAAYARWQERWAFVGAVAAMVVAVNSHLEFTVLATVSVAALWACLDRALLLSWTRDRVLVAAVALTLVCLGIRAAAVLATPIPGPPRMSELSAVAQQLGVLLAAGCLVVGAVATRRVPKRTAWLSAVLGLALVLTAGWWASAHTPFAGIRPDVEGWQALQRLHGFTSPDMSPPIWLPAFVVGVVLLATRRAGVVLFLGVSLAMLALFYAGRYDALSTLVRASLPHAVVLAIPTGVGLAALVEAVVPRGRPLAALLVPLATLPYAGWLGWSFPSQQEFGLLQLARQAAAEGATVFVLGPDDAPAGLDVAAFDYDYARAYAPRFIGTAGDTAPLHDLSPEPGDVFLLSLTCYRAVYGRMMPGAPVVELPIVVGDRAWRSAEPRRFGQSVLDAWAPCWHAPESARCVVQGVESCERWQCGGVASAAPPYRDPACQAVIDRFELTPIAEGEAHAGNLSEEFQVLLAEDARIGVYLIGSERP